MIDKDLAARLKSYRNFKHLTQKDVAAYLKVPHSAISDTTTIILLISHGC